MPPAEMETTVRFVDSADDLDLLEPLWNALQEHHGTVLPVLAERAPKRELNDAWRIRRAKYESWIEDPEAFYVLAESEGQPVGYAFVTVGPGYAAWKTGERLAEVETLSVLPAHRNRGLGDALLTAVWERLAEQGVEDLAITTALANVDSHRFYERHGFEAGFVVYYGRRGS